VVDTHEHHDTRQEESIAVITIVPTIDVEGVHGPRPFDELVLGEVGDSDTWGVYRLARIFNEHGVTGTFFVDVYEHALWGEGPLEEVCTRLAGLGQDVQLHTHPSWRDDPRDPRWLRDLKKDRSYLPQHLDLMTKLSKEQQVEVLQHGVGLFEKWLGRRPVAHRSGGYAVNEDTLRALRKTGIPMDSSMNAADRNSQTTWSVNRVEERQGVIELPVTAFKYTFSFALCGRRGPLYSKLMKTDLDVCTDEDWSSLLQQAKDTGLKVVNLFMHSYSLLRSDRRMRRNLPCPASAARLERTLARFSGDSAVRFMDCASLLARHVEHPEEFDGPDAVPRVEAKGRIALLALRKAANRLSGLVSRVTPHGSGK